MHLYFVIQLVEIISGLSRWKITKMRWNILKIMQKNGMFLLTRLQQLVFRREVILQEQRQPLQNINRQRRCWDMQCSMKQWMRLHRMLRELQRKLIIIQHHVSYSRQEQIMWFRSKIHWICYMHWTKQVLHLKIIFMLLDHMVFLLGILRSRQEKAYFVKEFRTGYRTVSDS